MNQINMVSVWKEIWENIVFEKKACHRWNKLILPGRTYYI